MNRYALALVAAVAGLWAGTAFGADDGPEAAPAATDRAVVQQLRSMNRQLHTLNNAIGNSRRYGRVLELLTEIETDGAQVADQIGDSPRPLNRTTVIGLLKAICDAVGQPVNCR